MVLRKAEQWLIKLKLKQLYSFTFIFTTITDHGKYSPTTLSFANHYTNRYSIGLVTDRFVITRFVYSI